RRDHQLDDAGRAAQSGDHQRQPPPAHRARQRHPGAGCEPAAEAVRAAPQDHEAVQGHGGKASPQHEEFPGIAPVAHERGGEHVPVVIRLRRTGTTKRPAYRVVVTDSRSPRDGRFIEVLGHYSPLTEPPTVSIDRAKVDAWIKKGAQPSNTVRRLIANAPDTTTIASAPAKK